MPPIEIDKILSDPLLIVAAVLLVVSPVLFLVALVKYIRAPRREDFAVPHHEFHSPLPSRSEPPPAEAPQGLGVVEETPNPAAAPAAETAPAPAVSAASETSPDLADIAPTPPLPKAPSQPRMEPASDRTIVMPPGMAEMQGEMENAFTQLKTLNKRVHEMEAQIRALQKELARTQSKGDEPGGEKPMPL